MYGVLVTRTGWKFEYIDSLCLSRAIELLEYWRRESEAQAKASGQPASNRKAEPDVPEFNQPDESLLEAQFASAPRANAMQPGFDQNVSRIPQHLRDMISWAEDVKTKRGIN